MKKILPNLPGIFLCFGIAVLAWLAGARYPMVGGPVFGILFGILLTTLFPGLFGRFQLGIRYTSKKLLQAAIVLLGFEMNLIRVIQVGGQSLLVMVFTLTAAFLMAWIVGKALHIPSHTTTLIGVGTAICGGSAIAAVAPVIRAESEDVAHAISTIFLFNILAVFLFPPLGHLLQMSDFGFGIWAGTAINDTSSVVAAAAAWSSGAGNNTALTTATIVKLTRTLIIIPICLVLAANVARKERAAGTFQLSKVFPWFVLFFLGVSVLNTVAGIPAPVSANLVMAGKFLIVMAMSAIGLSTNLVKLLQNGLRPILLGLSCWFAVAVVSIATQTMLQLW